MVEDLGFWIGPANAGLFYFGRLSAYLFTFWIWFLIDPHRIRERRSARVSREIQV